MVGFVSICGKSGTLRAGAFAGLIASTLALWYSSLGLPRPGYLPIPSGIVLSYRLDEPKAIYLWLLPDDSVQPLAFQLPWRDDVATNLVDAARSRATPDDSLRVANTREHGLIGGIGPPTKPLFYVTHVRALPPKATER
jgi:hypothetical protein